jgi:hypothetical protein
MNSEKKIHPSLVKAYRKTLYCSFIDGEIVQLEVGKVCNNLAIQLKQRNISTASFLTAYNPFSNSLIFSENEKLQNQLIDDVKSLGLHYFDGEGRDLDGKWQTEKSILILGISQQQSEILADRYSQNAFVWINTADAFVSLKLRYGLGEVNSEDIQNWINALPSDLSITAKKLSNEDILWMMSVTEDELKHWLNSEGWDLNKLWPLSRPDGTAMGVGTELDRMFKLVAAGVQRII